MDGSRASYYPYGEMRTGAPETLPTDYQFIGQEHEMAFGLYDCHARHHGGTIASDTLISLGAC